MLVLISHLFKVTENMYLKFYSENKLDKQKKDCQKSQVQRFLYQNKNPILLQLCCKMEMVLKENFIWVTSNKLEIKPLNDSCKGIFSPYQDFIKMAWQSKTLNFGLVWQKRNLWDLITQVCFELLKKSKSSMFILILNLLCFHFYHNFDSLTFM